MTGKHPKSDASPIVLPPDPALRQRADAIVQGTQQTSPNPVDDLLTDATRAMLHELRVHHIELELQNEELRRVQLELQAARDRYFDLYDLAPVGYCTVGAQGLIQQANLAVASLLGMTRDALRTQPFSRFVDRLDHDSYFSLRKRLLAADAPQACDLRMLAHDGRQFWAHLVATVDHQEDGAPVLRVVLSDITERKQAEKELRRAASVFTHASEGIVIATADGSIVDVNAAFSRITGYSRAEVLGQNPRLLKSGRQDGDFYAKLWRSLIETGHWSGEIWNRRKNGEIYAQIESINAVPDEHGQTCQYVALFSDISPLKAQQDQLEHIAHFDALTNLPNRALLADRLQQSMGQATRRGDHLGVVFLDFDGFKDVNDRYGHAVGDRLLVAMAARMRQALRECDTLARMGGDEFVAVLADLQDVADSVPLLERLLAGVAEPVQMGADVLHVTASLGVTFYPQAEAVDADQLLRQADQAMYQAKLAGKNRYHFFDAEQDRSIRGHHASLESMRLALLRGEFVLFYQPKVNMRSGQVVGVEALLRWQNPDNGLLPPAAFLPVIEDHPLAIGVGEWVMASALHQMAQWQAQGLDLPVSVNVGARQLQQSDFVDRLRQLLAVYPQVSPSRLELEILETSALNDVTGVSAVIAACRAMGVGFALDDFGTGYSSLTYLKRLPVSVLKIDQSFVHDMLNDPDDLAILQGVIGLAAAFRCTVVAEGVETEQQGTKLLQLGCELAQGYAIARPMRAHELPAWIARWAPPAAWGQAGG